jgi:tetratricopeptide (TPR) repeat protein
VRRVIGVLALVGLVALAATSWQALRRDRQYRDLLAQGDRALQAGNTYAAIEAFSGAVALRPTSMVAYYHRGEAYRAQKRDDEAIRDLREASRLAPDATRPLIALARLHDQRGDAAQAANYYEQAARRLKGVRDEDPALLYALALAHYRAGAPEAAKAPLQRILSRDDSLGEVHYLLGLAQRDTGNVDGAISALEQAVHAAPSLAAAREELADIYRQQGRVADETAQLQALAALGDSADRRLALAMADARRGQFDAALAALGETAARFPNDSRVELALGRVQLARAERALDRGSVRRALASLETALGGTARRSEGLALYGRALYLSGDVVGAERILREAAATSPVDLEAFAFLADAAEQQGHLAEARDALINLDSLQGDTAPSDVRAGRARRIGALSLRTGDSITAADFLTQAVEAGYVDGATLALLVQARWQAGQPEQARTVLDKALALEPRNVDLLRLAKTIR